MFGLFLLLRRCESEVLEVYLHSPKRWNQLLEFDKLLKKRAISGKYETSKNYNENQRRPCLNCKFRSR